MMSRAWRLLLVTCAVLVAAVALSSAYHPPFWDALGCYVRLGRFLEENGWRRAAFSNLDFFRPPLLLVLFAGVMRAGGGRLALHAVIWAFALLLPLGAWRITRRIGGSADQAALGTALCLMAPIFVAQAGIEQSDVPAAAMVTAAWMLALAGRRLGFVVVATLAILTKESAHVVLWPAALLWSWRAPGTRAQRLGRAALALTPYATLVGWLVIQRLLLGHLLSHGQKELLGRAGITSALLHAHVEGGRLVLTLLALPALRQAWRERASEPAARATLATAALVLLMPLAFPAGLPRYMMPSLPMHAALAARGLWRWAPRRTFAAGAAVLTLLLALWWAPAIDSHTEWHLESNLRYRALLEAEREAVRLVGAERPRAVLCRFPYDLALRAPPADGWLAAPVTAVTVEESDGLDELCRGDWLIVNADGTLERAKARLEAAHALTLVREWKAFGQSQRVYRVACPR